TPRDEGAPAVTGNAQISFPVIGSTATTRPYGVDRYIVPLTTIGVTLLPLNPPPRPRPRAACGASGSSPAAAPGLRAAPAAARPSGTGEVAGFMWYTH